jgi:hypothetical protein
LRKGRTGWKTKQLAGFIAIGSSRNILKSLGNIRWHIQIHCGSRNCDRHKGRIVGTNFQWGDKILL